MYAGMDICTYVWIYACLYVCPHASIYVYIRVLQAPTRAFEAEVSAATRKTRQGTIATTACPELNRESSCALPLSRTSFVDSMHYSGSSWFISPEALYPSAAATRNHETRILFVFLEMP